DLGGGVAEVGEDGVGVLAAKGGRAADAGGHAGEVERGADDRDLAELGVRHPLHDAAFGGLRVVHHLVHGFDRSGRHIGLLQALEQGLAVERADRGLEDALQLRAIGHPPLVLLEARVGGQVAEPEHLGELLPEAVVGRRDEDPLPVAALEVAIRRERRVARPERARRRAGEQIALGVEGEQAHRGLEQRAVDPLAQSGALPLDDRVGDAERAQDAGGQVEERDAGPHRLATRLAGDGHDAAEGLHQRLVARAVLARAGAPERGDRAVDEPPVDLRQHVLAEPEGLHGAGAEVLDDHVRVLHQPLDHLDGLRRLQVERDAALVPIEEQVRGGLPVLVRRPGARLVAGPGVLHLHDVRAQVGEQRAAPGSGDDAGEIDDADAVEGERRGREGCGHGAYYTAVGGVYSPPARPSEPDLRGGCAMELYDVMTTPFSGRDYTDEPLPDETLYRILDRARFAPSGGNRQGWKVIVVRDRKTREGLAAATEPAAKRYAAQVQVGESPWNTIDRTRVDAATIERTPPP